jgi:DNA-binding phage protein
MTRTAFDEFFDEQMNNPAFAEAYREARAEIDSVDAFMRAMESARVVRKMSKADLARASRLQPQTVRRLFTDENANPTIATVFSMLRPMGLGLQIVDLEDTPTRRTGAAPRKASVRKGAMKGRVASTPPGKRRRTG